MNTVDQLLTSVSSRRSAPGIGARVRTGLALLITLSLGSSLALGTTFTDRANGFSVTPPAGWKQGADARAAAFFSAPAPVNSVVSNLNVIVKTFSYAPTLNEFSSLSSAEVAQAFPGSTKEKTYTGSLDGQPAATTAYTLPVGGRRLVSVQTIVIVGKRVYILTGVTAESNAVAFGAVNATFIKSFRALR